MGKLWIPDHGYACSEYSWDPFGYSESEIVLGFKDKLKWKFSPKNTPYYFLSGLSDKHTDDKHEYPTNKSCWGSEIREWLSMHIIVKRDEIFAEAI